MRETICWLLVVAKHLTKLKTVCEGDHVVAAGGSKAFEKVATQDKTCSKPFWRPFVFKNGFTNFLIGGFA